MEKRQMTLMLSEKEMTVLDRMADTRGITKTAVVRQALRMFQSITERIESGDKVFFEKHATNEKSELMVL
jgi:predicted transcriptional regulator